MLSMPHRMRKIKKKKTSIRFFFFLTKKKGWLKPPPNAFGVLATPIWLGSEPLGMVQPPPNGLIKKKEKFMVGPWRSFNHLQMATKKRKNKIKL
jgi:hypothetical protein